VLTPHPSVDLLRLGQAPILHAIADPGQDSWRINETSEINESNEANVAPPDWARSSEEDRADTGWRQRREEASFCPPLIGRTGRQRAIGAVDRLERLALRRSVAALG
jgi:hypothetical protein